MNAADRELWTSLNKTDGQMDIVVIELLSEPKTQCPEYLNNFDNTADVTAAMATHWPRIAAPARTSMSARRRAARARQG